MSRVRSTCQNPPKFNWGLIWKAKPRCKCRKPLLIISYHRSRRRSTCCYSWWQTIFLTALRSHNLAHWARYQPSYYRLVPPLCSHHYPTPTNPIPCVSLRRQLGFCPLTDQQAPPTPARHSQRPNRLVPSDSAAALPAMFWNCRWGSTDWKSTWHGTALGMQKHKIIPTFAWNSLFSRLTHRVHRFTWQYQNAKQSHPRGAEKKKSVRLKSAVGN